MCRLRSPPPKIGNRTAVVVVGSAVKRTGLGRGRGGRGGGIVVVPLLPPPSLLMRMCALLGALTGCDSGDWDDGDGDDDDDDRSGDGALAVVMAAAVAASRIICMAMMSACATRPPPTHIC